MNQNKWLLSCVILLLSFYVAVALGSSNGMDFRGFIELRVARALLGAGVGASLAVAGVLLQALFSNPLCDPYTLGVSSGATLGSVLAYSLGLGFYALTGGALLGALGFTFLLLLIAHRYRLSSGALLLTGVMFSFFGSSLVSVWMAYSDPNGIQGALGWLLGDLARARLNTSVLGLVIEILLIACSMIYTQELDLFLLGEKDAKSVGLDQQKIQFRVLVLASLLISFAVSQAGMIGFVGLVIPHLSRIWGGVLHRRLIPLSAVLGASFVMISDGLGRVAARPYELPVGVITALIGAPLFILFMIKKGSGHASSS